MEQSDSGLVVMAAKKSAIRQLTNWHRISSILEIFSSIGDPRAGHGGQLAVISPTELSKVTVLFVFVEVTTTLYVAGGPAVNVIVAVLSEERLLRP